MNKIGDDFNMEKRRPTTKQKVLNILVVISCFIVVLVLGVLLMVKLQKNPKEAKESQKGEKSKQETMINGVEDTSDMTAFLETEGTSIQNTTEEAFEDTFDEIEEGYYDYTDADKGAWVSVLQDEDGQFQVSLRYNIYHSQEEVSAKNDSDRIKWTWEKGKNEYTNISENLKEEYTIIMYPQEDEISVKIYDENESIPFFANIIQRRAYLNGTNIIIAMKKVFEADEFEKLDSSMEYILPSDAESVGLYGEDYIVPIYDAELGVDSEPVYYVQVASEEREDGGSGCIYQAEDWNNFTDNGGDVPIPIQEFNLEDYGF